MLVKICGIRTKSAAISATKFDADFLGFNFVPWSKRKVTVKKAKQIILSLPNQRPLLVGVYVNQPLNFVLKTAHFLKLDYLQLHGNETVNYCKLIKQHKFKIIKAFALESNFNLNQINKKLQSYKKVVDIFLLDRLIQGTGKVLSFNKVKKIAKNFPILLAGGLNTKNITPIIKIHKILLGLDVAGGIESHKKIDIKKMEKFIKIVKS